MMRQFELVDRVVGYDPTTNEDLLNRAYVYATKMHGDQKRASGDPYFSHPVEVAGILTELRLDAATVATGLLHDTLEDTQATYDDINNLFGGEIAQMVEGVTKMSQLELASTASAQAENVRKLLLATASDIRILLVKLADRLHNMRTLHYISVAEKRRRIAQETMEIYAPLAARMGMQHFREEYEDLAFAEVNPEARDLVLARLAELTGGDDTRTNDIAEQLRQELADAGVSARVYGRTKRPFSIWQKMQNKSIALEQLADVFAYRVITQNVAACYQALGVLHQSYQCVPERLKDYISTPKRNGYRSLHTTLIGPTRQRAEIQIRTKEMEDVANEGVAAHWLHKEGQDTPRDFAALEPFTWLRDMMEQIKTGASAEEFLENTKLELFTDQVFCFTPKGRLIALPKGAGIVDFAYAVHTQIGHSCAGARVNGKHASRHTALNNGDQIEIIRAKGQLPHLRWLKYVRTGKARAAIRQAVREQEASDYAKLGEKMVKSLFSDAGVAARKSVIERALGVFDYDTLANLYAAVGRGEVSAAEVMLAALPDKQSMGRRGLSGAMQQSRRGKKPAPQDMTAVAAVDFELENMAVKFAPHCFPLPGDAIVGIMRLGEGLLVFPESAPALAAYEGRPETFVAMRWRKPKKGVVHLFDSRLILTIINKPGALSRVGQTVADFGANISNLALTQRDADFYDLRLDIEVRDAEHAEHLVAALAGSSVVSRAERLTFDPDMEAEQA